MARTKRGELPKLTRGADGRWSVNVRTSTGTRRKVWLGGGIDGHEAARRHRLICRDLDALNQLPPSWDPPWQVAKAARARSAGVSTWEAFFELVRRRDIAHQRNTDNAAIAAASPYLPQQLPKTTPAQLRAMMQGWGGSFARLTQYKYLRVIKVALSTAVERGLLTRAMGEELAAALKPVSHLENPKHADKVTAPEDVARVIESLGQPWRDIATLLLLTGCRPGELLNARPRELDTDAAGHRWLVPVTHKNRHRQQRRRIPLVGRAWALIAERSAGKPLDDLILPSSAGTPIHYSTVSNALKAACRRLGVKPFTCYALRHLAITETLRERGLLHASRLAGHASPDVTLKVYSHALDADGIEAAEALARSFSGRL